MKILTWAVVAVVFFGLGGLATALFLRSRSGASAPVAAPSRGSDTPAPTTPAGPGDDSADVEVLLTSDAVGRLGIKTAKVGTTTPTASIELPGSVMANAYREVKVTPVAGGVVTKVQVELGATVKRGTPLVTLFSSELADAQMKYLSMQAAFEADHKKLDRTQQLVRSAPPAARSWRRSRRSTPLTKPTLRPRGSGSCSWGSRPSGSGVSRHRARSRPTSWCRPPSTG